MIKLNTHQPAGKQKNDYKTPTGCHYCSNEKTNTGFGVNFFAKQEKIMTKQNPGVQIVTKLKKEGSSHSIVIETFDDN